MRESITESPYSYVVEFSNEPSPTVGAGAFGISNDSLTCNEADGGTTGWVDATGDLSVFDVDEDGRYEGITRARYSLTENVSWDEAESLGMRVFFQAQVKQDLSLIHI